MGALLEITDLHVNQGQRRVIRGVSAEIGFGEIVGVVGQNGSGKSTLISTIAGAVPAQGGAMRLSGEPYSPESSDAAKSAGVSYVPQSPHIPADLTVPEAIFRGTFLAGADEHELRDRAEEHAAAFGLQIDLAKPVAQLHAAERTFLEVLRVAAEESKLVVLDEVSVVLNDAEVIQLHVAIRRLRDQGRSIVYVAHRLEELLAIVDRVLIVRDGQIAEDTPSRGLSPDMLAFKMLQRPAPLSARQGSLEDPATHIVIDRLHVPGAVEAVSIDLHVGEAFGIVGLRSSGAHELAQALGGVVEGSVASIALGDERFDSIAEVGDRIAYLGGFREEETDERIALLLANGQNSESEIMRLHAAAQLARELDLTTSNIQDTAASLSIGDRQKVAVATLAGTTADLVVLDHPTRGVDLGAIERVHAVVRGLLSAGKTAVFISNDLGEVLRVSHRIGVMHEGRLVAVLENAATNEDEIMSYVEGGTAEHRHARGAGRRQRRTVDA